MLLVILYVYYKDSTGFNRSCYVDFTTFGQSNVFDKHSVDS